MKLEYVQRLPFGRFFRVRLIIGKKDYAKYAEQPVEVKAKQREGSSGE